MATRPCSASNLPWLFVIEALASSKHVDASVLIDLVKRAPDISDDLGKNAREMVSLRILESLCAQRNEIANGVLSGPADNRGFDPSDRCEDVLQRILNEMSASNLKMAGTEMSKWDVQPFILHKRSCLPKCALQQLKDVILEGSHPLPILASLKERSGLTTREQSDNRVTVDVGDANGIARRPEGSSDEKASPTTGDGSGHFQENSPNRNLSPAKRDRNVSTSENVEAEPDEYQTLIDSCVPHSNVSKKLKQGAHCSRQATGDYMVSVHGTELIEDLSEKNVQQQTARGETDLSKEIQIGALEECRFPGDGHSNDGTSVRLGQTGALNNVESLHDQQQIPCSEDEVQNDTSGDGQGQNIIVDEDKKGSCRAPQNVTWQTISAERAKEKYENIFQQNASRIAAPDEQRADMDYNHERETSIDSDGSHADDIIDIATKKHTFLSSQCANSQDYLATADFSGLNLCMKCNRGGRLLICSTNSCPIVVHEGCLKPAACFDEKGNFYCPFCAYSQAISEYLEVKKKASSARKDLAAFLGSKSEHGPRNYSERLCRPEHNHSRQNAKVGENNEATYGKDYVDKVNKTQCQATIEDQRPSEPFVLGVNDDLPYGEKEAAVTNETHYMLMEGNCEGEKMGQECQSPRGLEEPWVAVEDVANCGISNSMCRDAKIIHGIEEPSEIGQQLGVEHQLITDLPQKNAQPPRTGVDDGSEDDDEKPINWTYPTRSKRREMQYTYPAIPQLRRKKLPWTKVEEEKLKEGVQRLTSVHDRNIPWKKILEFGGDVFQKGRTTIDLKDKWRNISKGSPKSKK